MVAGFVKVCNESELAEGKIKVVEQGGEQIILAKQGDEVFALEGYCSHDGGEFEADEDLCCEGQIECPRHGGRFDIKTGEATQMPAIAPIRIYTVKVENGEVFVSTENT